ncbi:mitogen-activated protein kinase kinase [Perkinsus chesapeaki]|uniref:Mitogen-activated protein kinase kinase n=1 Tax=Perkinsus chesapeaki TaxID=330153 RepID=A0A7J6N5M8_PERCH|nr:mitogen-activated protein kinase kinase [Perkinsus chesapeaki]
MRRWFSAQNDERSSVESIDACGGPTIKSFFVYSPVLEVKDRSEEFLASAEDDDSRTAQAKLIYYYPSREHSAIEQRTQASLIEGVVHFAQAFRNDGDEDDDVDLITTRDLAISVKQVEKDIWFTLVVQRCPLRGADSSQSIPSSPEGASNAETQRQHQTRCVQSHEIDEDPHLSGPLLQAVLSNAHEVFTLLHGPMREFLDVGNDRASSISALVGLMDDFIPSYMEVVGYGPLGLFNELTGFSYAPVERNTLVLIQAMLLSLKEKHPDIIASAVLFDAHLLHSSIPLEDMKILYSYIVSTSIIGFRSDTPTTIVSSTKLCEPPYEGSDERSKCFAKSNYVTEDMADGEAGTYLFGPDRGSADGGYIPMVHLPSLGRGRLVSLLYHGLMFVLVLSPTPSKESDAELFAALQQWVSESKSVSQVAHLVRQQFDQAMSVPDDSKFVYANNTNHALRVSNDGAASLSDDAPTALIGNESSPEDLVLFSTLRQIMVNDEQSLDAPGLCRGSRCREICYKSPENGWVCAKASPLNREFYLMLAKPAMPLVRCQEECERFARTHLSNIFTM